MADDQGHSGGMDRRGLLKCMGWTGTGVLWTIAGGGVPSAIGLDQALAAPTAQKTQPFTFMQVSDSHIGFMKPANPDSRVTYREAIARIKALPTKPAFMIHTGDISQLSKPEEFDDADQITRESGLETFFVPGEHDVLDEENGEAYRDRYAKQGQGDGWYAFDHSGVHFIALVNVMSLKAGGAGSFGPAQLAWLKADLAGRRHSQPIVVFTHVPMWTVYQDWGWGTDDAAEALSYLKPFGSVTVLNGHIHQILQKVEGDVAFYTADSTAFPQPAPGSAPSPGPMKVPEDKLRSVLGVRRVDFVRTKTPLAVTDTPLSA